MAVILAAGEAAAQDAAVAALAAGRAVALATDTVYGLAAAAGVAGATAQLFRAKGRPPEVALAVLVASTEDALALMAPPLPAALTAMQRWWPGPLTVVVGRSGRSAALDLGGDASTIGLRCPDHDVVRAIAGRVGPLATTSANRHGRATPETAAGVAEELGDTVALVLDGGPCAGAPSTVVSFAGGAPVLLRGGRLPWADLVASLGPGPPGLGPAH